MRLIIIASVIVLFSSCRETTEEILSDNIYKYLNETEPVFNGYSSVSLKISDSLMPINFDTVGKVPILDYSLDDPDFKFSVEDSLQIVENPEYEMPLVEQVYRVAWEEGLVKDMSYHYFARRVSSKPYRDSLINKFTRLEKGINAHKLNKAIVKSCTGKLERIGFVIKHSFRSNINQNNVLQKFEFYVDNNYKILHSIKSDDSISHNALAEYEEK